MTVQVLWILITKKFSDAGFPPRFIASVMRDFKSVKDEPIIPEWLFEDRRSVVIHVPYCELNENEVRKFTDKLSIFTKDKFKFVIVWQTRKIRSLFPLKDKSKYPSCVIYEGVCSCGEVYIGEMDRNCDVRWDEHDTPTEKSDPAKHLLKNTTHKF